ncbi:MAG TPA: HK97 family phage prohead protease [Alphaproteobacteria bacterium]|nr:HK97 family phage prohead protease [Alphaproteobacteria bacterium]
MAQMDGIIEGYASLFGVTDQAGDRVAPGAFTRSLTKKGASGIRMLYQHLAAEPVGVWTLIKEDARGLFVRGRLLAGIGRAREVLALIRAGALDGLSIGFRTINAVRRPGETVRTLTEIDLWEVSVVTFPMLDAARVTSVKARADMCFKTRTPHLREGRP